MATRGRSKSPAPRSKSPAPARRSKSPAAKGKVTKQLVTKGKSAPPPSDEVLGVVGAAMGFTALHFANLAVRSFSADAYYVMPCPNQGANCALSFFARGCAFKVGRSSQQSLKVGWHKWPFLRFGKWSFAPINPQ